MRKVLEDESVVCLSCGDGLDGVLIDFKQERNEKDPDCELCEQEKVKTQRCGFLTKNNLRGILTLTRKGVAK